MGRVEGLAGKDVDDSILKMNLAAKGKIEEFLGRSWTAACNECIVFLDWQEALILHDAIRISEVADEIGDDTQRFSRGSTESSSELLKENAFRIRGTEKEEALNKRQVGSLV